MYNLDDTFNKYDMNLPCDAYECVCEVFPTPEEQIQFIEALTAIQNRFPESKIYLGGRRLREILGYLVIDFTDKVIPSLTKLSEKELINLGPLVSILQEYPLARMAKPDLDFFYYGIYFQNLNELLAEYGFNPRIVNASGGARIVEIEATGLATFVSVDESWQVNNWPKFGVKARFLAHTEYGPVFNLCCPVSYLTKIPLETMDTRHFVNAFDSQVLAQTFRSILWLITARTPNGEPLPVPSDQTQEEIIQRVNWVSALIHSGNYPIDVLKTMYGSVLRDIALTVWLLKSAENMQSNIELIKSAILKNPACITQNEIDRQVFMYNIISAWESGIKANVNVRNIND